MSRRIATIQRGPAPPALHNSVAEAWFGTFKEELIHGRWGDQGAPHGGRPYRSSTSADVSPIPATVSRGWSAVQAPRRLAVPFTRAQGRICRRLSGHSRHVLATPLTYGLADNGDVLFTTWQNNDAVRNLGRGARASVLIDKVEEPYAGVHFTGSVEATPERGRSRGVRPALQPVRG